MKTILLILSLLSFVSTNAQWVKKLSMSATERCDFISAPTNNIVWVVTGNKQFYTTTNGGNSWNKRTASGIASNTSSMAFYAIDASTALLAVNTNFTGIGPGIIYKTSDTGKTWKQVFTHPGNCEFSIDFSNSSIGLMTCSFSSFNGSIPAGKQLLNTTNGGESFTTNRITDPGTSFFYDDVIIHGRNAWLLDDSFIYNTTNGVSWISQRMPLKNAVYNNLQVVNNEYMIVNESSLINMYIKRPGTAKWIHIGDPTGSFGGALTCMVLDGNECWFSLPFDTNNNYYSSDSAKTFTPFVVDSQGGFAAIEKAKHGSNLWACVNFSRSIYMLDRSTPPISSNENKSSNLAVK